MARPMDRRTFLVGVAGGVAGTLLAPSAARLARAEPVSLASTHYAFGKSVAVATSSTEATEAALWALAEGGNAADAYITAALTQTVVEPGLTSLGGAFGVTVFEAASKATRSAVGLMGPAAAEPYDYPRFDPVSLTGRGMTVPGFLAGVKLAHETTDASPGRSSSSPPSATPRTAWSSRTGSWAAQAPRRAPAGGQGPLEQGRALPRARRAAPPARPRQGPGGGRRRTASGPSTRASSRRPGPDRSEPTAASSRAVTWRRAPSWPRPTGASPRAATGATRCGPPEPACSPTRST